MSLRSKKAFALAELLILITAIIGGGISASIVPSVTGAPVKARDAARKANVNTLAIAAESFLNDNGHYPGKLVDGQGHAECLAKGGEVAEALKIYMGDTIPTDPIKDRKIQYTADFDCGIADTANSGAFFYSSLHEEDEIISGAIMIGALLENDSGNNMDCFGPTAFLKDCDSYEELQKLGDSGKVNNGNAFVYFTFF